MKKYLFIITAILLASCGGKKNTENGTIGEASTDTLQSAVPATIDKGTERSGYTFETQFRKDENGQCDALIVTCKKGEKTQQFTCEFNWPKNEDLLGESGTIEEEDLNFDGTPDLLVTLGDFGVNPGLYPTIFYAGFVWNEEKQCFEQVKQLDDMPNIVVDAEKKAIISEYATPVGDEFHEVYAWQNGKLEMIEESHTNAFEEGEEE